MLAMGGVRSYHIVCSVIMLILLATIAAPLAPTWIRNSINFGCYCFFTTVCNYLKEKADRRVFLLRYELKKQAKATQSAMAREDAEGASKKRVSFRSVRWWWRMHGLTLGCAVCPLSSSPSAHPRSLGILSRAVTDPDLLPPSCSIFHEVRVPLNTALLAVQNLESANVFEFEGTKEHDLEVSELPLLLRFPLSDHPPSRSTPSPARSSRSRTS